MQITFNSYEEMMEFMEKMKGQEASESEPAVPVAGAEKQGGVPYGRQIAPHFPNANVDAAPAPGAPVSVPAQDTPAAPSAPAQTAAPTSRHEYTMDELARAAMTVMDKNGMAQLQQLLAGYNCETLQQLPQEQYGSFATALRGMGAQI